MITHFKETSDNSIKIINLHQKGKYEGYEEESVSGYFYRYNSVFEKFKDRQNINILDIGGASGHFAIALYKKFEKNNCKVFVVDTTRYSTWDEEESKVEFIESSADNLKKLFKENTFDIVFANLVFHHFVKSTWKKSLEGMHEIMNQIAFIMKKGGYFLVSDHFYNGFLWDKATNRIVYTLTTCSLSPIIKLCKKMGAESAGIGVCFLSEKMWYDLFSRASIEVERVHYGVELGMKWYKKLLLCRKSILLNNMIILRKK
jgi:ubiquinone/menaquinone biosynthesis C-methylase UbiE